MQKFTASVSKAFNSAKEATSGVLNNAKDLTSDVLNKAKDGIQTNVNKIKVLSTKFSCIIVRIIWPENQLWVVM